MRWTDGVVRDVLPNGLTVLVQRDPTSTVAAVVTHMRAGYFDEPDEWVGISHVLEHMYFKGTARRGVGALARETKRAGGYLNAGTIYDRTQYYTVVPSESIATAIELQSDALLHARLDEDELAREIEVIVQEARQKLDNPGAVTVETLYELLFDRHRMRRWRIGTEESLRRLTRQDVVAYYESRYVPRRTIVVVAGGVDPEHVLELAREAYGPMPDRPPASDPSPSEPDHVGLRRRWRQGDVRKAILALGWRTFGPHDPRTPGLDMAAVVAGEGRGSWGYRHLRGPGVVTALDASHYTPTEVGVFQLFAETEPQQATAALAGMWAVVRRLRDVGPHETDMTRARSLVETAWARRFETAAGRAIMLAEFEALGGYALADEYIEQLVTVTPGDVRAAAAELTIDRAAAAGYFPDDASVDANPAHLGRLFEDAGDVSALTPRSDSLPELERAKRGRVERVGDVIVLDADGVQVLVMPKHGVPLLAIGAVVVGPRALEGPAVAGSSLLFARTALRGAGGLDRDTLAVEAERLGGSLATLLAPDWVGWRLTVRSESLDHAARLLATLPGDPALADPDVFVERDLLERDIRHAADDMFRRPLQLALSAGFGDDPYGQPGLGTLESVASLDGGAVRRWYEDTIRGGRLVVGAVGDVDPVRAAESLAAAFSGWEGRPSEAPGGATTWTEGGERVERRQKQQSAFTLAFPAFARSMPERHALEILVAIASGLGGRLFDVVRDQRALAYTVMAAPWLWHRAGLLYAYAATAPERAAEARDLMVAELARFNREDVSADELAGAVHFTAGMLRVRRQSGAAVLHDLFESHLSGRGVEELAEDEPALRAVTPAHIRIVAERVFGVPPTIGAVEGGS
jgi:zinc protease